MNKKDIVKVLERIGTMMEIKGENPFKVRACFSGARTLQTIEEDLCISILQTCDAEGFVKTCLR
ncbi:hypothetical protein OAK38_09860 [Verrucomicrobia bacterium]|nr:hypothetical protein [Verrucomicrobiota bacterium]